MCLYDLIDILSRFLKEHNFPVINANCTLLHDFQILQVQGVYKCPQKQFLSHRSFLNFVASLLYSTCTLRPDDVYLIKRTSVIVNDSDPAADHPILISIIKLKIIQYGTTNGRTPTPRGKRARIVDAWYW